MHRRRIIRSLALALLMLCLTAWVGSHFRSVSFFYSRDAISGLVLDVKYGSLRIFTSGQMSVVSEHFDWFFGSASPRLPGELPARTYLGFGWDSAPAVESMTVLIPLWFPTTLSAGFLWLVWRKTRPNSTGKGFPVEPAATETTKP
jgi:hypothetical protein